MTEAHEFVSLRKINFMDVGEQGLALRLETQHSPTHGQAYAFGCLMNESQGRQFLQEFSNALESKWGKKNKNPS